MSKVASGGEKSRILFALKSILAKKVNLPTLVFDEIDSGTSGEIANSIGGMMKVMGKKIQIFQSLILLRLHPKLIIIIKFLNQVLTIKLSQISIN